MLARYISKPALKTRGVLVVVLVAELCVQVGTFAAEPAKSAESRERARALMLQGAQQMDDRRYDQAVESFSAAYALVQSPKVLYNLGIAYLSVARYADALRAFEGFLAEAPDAPAAKRDTARRHLVDLRKKIASLDIESDRSGAELTMDGRSLGTVTFDHRLAVDPGSHELRARDGSDTVERTFTVAAGEARSVTLIFARAISVRSTPEPPKSLLQPTPAPPVLSGSLVAPAQEVRGPRPTRQRPWFWVAVGGGVAVAVAVALALTLKRNDYPSADTRIPGP
jgi:hypothetical protein